MSRILYLDWLRGVAVLLMMLWHAVDSWTRLDARQSPAFGWIVVAGGCAAPLFLFLAGVAVPLAGAAKMARGATRVEASRSLLGRGWQVIGVGVLFHFQGFLLNPNAKWSHIVTPDILNILGIGLVVTAWAWRFAVTPARAGAWLVLPALLCVAIVTPWIRQAGWPAGLPVVVEAYLRPVANFGVFTMFPWVAFVLAGAAAGMIVAHDTGPSDRIPLWLAGGGAAVILAGAVGTTLPPILTTSFWTTSLSLFLIRCGGVAVALAVAWSWRRIVGDQRFGPVVVLGQTSLFVYWVHVELVYGGLSSPLHHALPLGGSLAGVVVLTAVMLVLATWWKRWRAARDTRTYGGRRQLDSCRVRSSV